MSEKQAKRKRKLTPQQVAQDALAHLAVLYEQLEQSAMKGENHPAAVYAPEAESIVYAGNRPQKIVIVGVSLPLQFLKDVHAAYVAILEGAKDDGDSRVDPQ